MIRLVMRQVQLLLILVYYIILLYAVIFTQIRQYMWVPQSLFMPQDMMPTIIIWVILLLFGHLLVPWILFLVLEPVPLELDKVLERLAKKKWIGGPLGADRRRWFDAVVVPRIHLDIIIERHQLVVQAVVLLAGIVSETGSADFADKKRISGDEFAATEYANRVLGVPGRVVDLKRRSAASSAPPSREESGSR